jgi:arsenate reductase
MAEGFLRAMGGARMEVASAGTEKTRVHALAIQAMRECGIDINGQESKTLDRFLDEPWDHVITVCDHAHESCPVFPRAAHRLHWSFEDPSRVSGTDEERLQAFRRIRDEISERIRAWIASELR